MHFHEKKCIKIVRMIAGNFTATYLKISQYNSNMWWITTTWCIENYCIRLTTSKILVKHGSNVYSIRSSTTNYSQVLLNENSSQNKHPTEKYINRKNVLFMVMNIEKTTLNIEYYHGLILWKLNGSGPHYRYLL